MLVKRFVLILGCSLFWVGCTSANKQPSSEHWTIFSSKPFSQSEVIKEGHTRIVFIRDKEGLKGPAANIFVAGHYLTSLLPGGYKTQQLCTQPTRITAAYTRSDLDYSQVRQQNSQQQLSEGVTQYFRLVNGEHQSIQLQALEETQALAILPNLKEEVHTVSRVKEVQECVKPVYVPVPVKTVLKKYTLEASTLFSYAKSGANDLTPKGRQEVAAIASEISRDQDGISHIAVIGYTDPVGSEISNQQLSQRRAETVRSLLVQNNVMKNNILVEGRGEQDLIVSDCEQRYAKDKSAREQCDFPNRRVEIVTYGMKAE